MWKNNIALIFSMLILAFSNAQDTLTLENALDIALKQNFQIEIARNNLKIAENNNHAGNAGMLPNVAINIGDTPSQNNIRQEFSNGTSIVRDGVNANNFNAQLALSMTLFDGGKMFATREKLNELERLGEQNLKAQIQNMLSQVIQSYYYILTQKNYLEVLQHLSDISDARLSLIITRLDVGLANVSDQYLAEIDRDASYQAVIAQQSAIFNAYASLNELLKFPADSSYQVQRKITYGSDLNRTGLDPMFEQNPEFLAENSRVKVALQSEKEASAARYPKVTLSAAYGYLLTKSQAGFSLYNQAYGPTGTLTLSVPLFSGNVNKSNYRSAILQKKNADLTKDETVLALQVDYEQAWQLYDAASLQVKSGEQTVITADKYLSIMQQRYELGESTILELREAQRALNDSSYRLYSNQYLLKLAETDLLRLTGQLVR